MLSPRVLKPLASACTLAELGCLSKGNLIEINWFCEALFEDNVLGVTIQHMGTEENIIFKAQEVMIIPELAVQGDE